MEDWEDYFKSMTRGEHAHLYRTHPNFDNYPQYMKDALVANEVLQGRVKKN